MKHTRASFGIQGQPSWVTAYTPVRASTVSGKFSFPACSHAQRLPLVSIFGLFSSCSLTHPLKRVTYLISELGRETGHICVKPFGFYLRRQHTFAMLLHFICFQVFEGACQERLEWSSTN